VCGHPQYDYVYEQTERLSRQGKKKLRHMYFPSAPKEKKVAVFATEQPGGLDSKHLVYSDDYTMIGRGRSNTRNEIVLEEFLDAVALLNDKPYLVLRLHPKCEKREFEPYIEEFDQISQKEPALDLIYAADYVFGMTSMLLLEAIILGIPTFSILVREEEKKWLPITRLGLTNFSTNRDEIKMKMPKFLQNSPYLTKDQIENYFIFGASEKALLTIETILQKTRKLDLN
jgi:hypothetical protein